MFCSAPLLESIYGAQNGDLYSKSRFWEPFKISRGPENAPRGDHFAPTGLQRASRFYRGVRPFRDPAFHETIVILVPLGPSVFKNIIFSLVIGYFSVFCFSLCYVLYVMFITFVEKTWVNAQPLSPPIFEKIAPDFKKQRFFLFCFFTFAFFYTFPYFR